MLLPIHIAAGGLAIVFGAIALLFKKGRAVHRRSGQMFVGAMLVMGTTAMILAKGLGGLGAMYYAVTALTAVRPATRSTRRIDAAALIIAIGLTGAYLYGGVQAFNSPSGSLNGAPYGLIFFFAGLMIFSIAGDVRAMRAGGLRGGPRLARHLWRMCFALFTATASFFSIGSRVAKVLPAPFTTVPMRMLPILLVLVAMFYWLWRVRGRRILTGVLDERKHNADRGVTALGHPPYVSPRG